MPNTYPISCWLQIRGFVLFCFVLLYQYLVGHHLTSIIISLRDFHIYKMLSNLILLKPNNMASGLIYRAFLLVASAGESVSETEHPVPGRRLTPSLPIPRPGSFGWLPTVSTEGGCSPAEQLRSVDAAGSTAVHSTALQRTPQRPALPLHNPTPPPSAAPPPPPQTLFKRSAAL